MKGVIFLIGIIAAILTSASFLPQVIKAYRSKHTKDLSFIMYMSFSIGLIFWLVYGYMLGEVPILLANGFTLMMTLCILLLKIKYG